MVRLLGMLVWVGLVAIGLPVGARAESGRGGLDALVRGLSPELRRKEQRLVEIERELELLPELFKYTYGSRFGYHSGPLATETQESWVVYELKQTFPVDTIVLVPAYLSYLGKQGEGYGFPKRFKLEVADNPEMRGAVTVADCSRSDVTNPGRYPLIWRFPAIDGRFVRVTALKHASDQGGFFWAMEEMMVFSRGINVGISAKKTTSSWLDLFPQWGLVRLSDGQSALGMPVDVTTPSPTKGFLSGTSPTLQDERWLTVDLQQPQVIEQVNLLPVESDDYEAVGGRVFPKRFSMELALDANFEQVVWHNDSGGYPLGYPSGCALTFQVPELEARYLRIMPNEMWLRDSDYRFGLAEVQVMSGGVNVALGKPVAVSDRADKPAESGWAPEYVVDGFTSRYRLIGWPEYLDLIETRRHLALEQRALRDECAHRMTTGRRLVLSSGVVALVALFAGWVWAVARGRILRRREVSLLRDQIARDLHDDIGSNLGGIVLLSEIGCQQCSDAESRQDFETIRRAAEDASAAMRDIVWLIQREPVGLKDLVTRMRQSLQLILKPLDIHMEVEPAAFRDRRLGLMFRRHLFLAFKEVLNNVRKHSQTARVEVEVAIGADRLRFRVRDEGVGFDPQADNLGGYGLGNLKQRAERVSGSVRINSAPGRGTEVIFDAPFSN